jgi:hypothetical protein
MKVRISENKLIEIFCFCDEFCQFFERWLAEYHPEYLQKFTGQLCPSEIMTILISYHLSGYKNFEYYYQEFILEHHRSDFPQAISYKRFLAYIPRIMDYIYFYLQLLLMNTPRTGTYFIDSTKILACNYLRRYQHRVFEGLASVGKTSTGWFYGFKIHLIINDFGDLVRAEMTPANIADNQQDLLKRMLSGLQGTVVGDKGYLSKLRGYFYEQGINLVTKARNNMKNNLLTLADSALIQGRGVIESVIDLLKSVCNVEHTRHRSPINAFTHMLAGLVAYQFLDEKPKYKYA